MLRHLRRADFARRDAAARPRLFALENRETPALFTVTTAADSGAGSMRQAIVQANAAPGADTIDFDTGFGGIFQIPQTITLSAANGQLGISSDLTIIGTGPSMLTISAAGANSRVFSVSGAGTLAVTISGMTITGGTVVGDGGGINYDNESLTLDGVVVTGNSATGGTGNSGGGVSDILGGTLTVRNSTISGNTASGRGGGIYFFNGGNLLLEHSTVSGNTAADINGGGGVYFFGTVGTGGVTIRSSTIASNSAPNGGGVGLRAITGSVLVQNSTLAFNTSTSTNTAAGFGGGGICVETGASPVLTLFNTVVSGNTASAANGRADIAVNSTATVNGDYCSIFDPDGFTLSPAGANNRAFGEDPLFDLAGLFTNGGPTATIALQPTSPLKNSGPVFQPGFPFDQRGSPYQRVRGSSSDIGAFEIQVAAPPSVVGVLVNGGNAIQRSRVTSIAVTFNTVVSFATTGEAAFTIQRETDLATVNFNVTTTINGQGQSVVVLNNFTSGTAGATEFGSLADGRWRLTALAFQIRAGQAPLPVDYVFSSAEGLYRLFGDMAGGDRRIDIADFGFMSLAYLQQSNYNAALDFNADGRIDIADFGQFSVRYFTTLP